MGALTVTSSYFSKQYDRILLLFLSLLIFSLALLSPVTYASSDPHFSLIVSQAILEHGTTSLDAYYDQDPALFDAHDYQVDIKNGHWHYNFPLGPSLLAIPLVAIARLTGSDMLVASQNHQWQNIISALLVTFVFLTCYWLVRIYLATRPALILTLIMVLGSALISTLATAFWNLGFAVLFILLCLIILARYDSGRSQSLHPYLIGLFLFAAFLNRPTTVIFIAIVLCYLLIKDRGALIRAASLSLFLLILFLIFSQTVYGSWLPRYYTPGHRLGVSSYLDALYGVILSPSRGLLVYSPFLLVTLIVLVIYVWRRQSSFILWLSCGWVALHLVMVSLFRLWWGGFSFGPRLLTDIFPAFLLISAVIWDETAGDLSRIQRRLIVGSYLLLGMVAIIINSFIGLFNIKTPLWNAYPNIDNHPSYLFDWQYPQFLVTTDRFHQRRLEHQRQRLSTNPDLLEPYEVGDILSFESDPEQAIFVGWWPASNDATWTEVDDPRILFIPDLASDVEMSLLLSATSFGRQPVGVYLNDILLGEVVFSGQETQVDLPIHAGILRPGELNYLRFQIPGARNPSLAELRNLGLRFAPHRLGLGNVAVQIVDGAIK